MEYDTESKLAMELREADKVIKSLWAMMQKAGIPDDAGWPYLRQDERARILNRLEG